MFEWLEDFVKNNCMSSMSDYEDAFKSLLKNGFTENAQGGSQPLGWWEELRSWVDE